MYAEAFPIRVPSDILEALGAFTGHFWSDSLKLEPHVCAAIRAYINPAPPAQQQQPAAPSEQGYQWKQVFLPDGTRLRASFDHKPYFAVVEGAEIKYGDYAISPSCFANLHGSGNRNAWKTIWLRLPGSNEWLLADVCRSARKAVIAHMFGGDAQQADKPSAVARRLPPETVKQPAPRHSAPPQTQVRPSSAPSAAGGDEVKRKKGSGRSARRKRRAKKHIPVNS